MSNSSIHADRPNDGPSPALAGPGMVAAVRRGFLATRPPFLIAAVTPVAAGTLPFANVLELRGTLIYAYRIYIDNSPLAHR